MKPLGLVFAVMLAVSTALAQHGGGHSGGGHSGGGGGHSGGSGGYHGSGGGGSVSGRGGYSGGRSYGRSGSVYIAPAYSYGYYAPLAYGAGSYGSGYADTGYGYAAPPPVEEAPPPQAMDFGPNGGQPDPPPNEDGSLRIYTAPAPSPQDAAISEGRYYLIAYKDHSVYTALAFWMENGALNYVTPQNAHNQVSLDRLDLDLTKQLNSRHGMAFNLPTP